MDGFKGSSATPQADRVADKERRIQEWVSGGMKGDLPPSNLKGISMYEFYGGPGDDVVSNVIDETGTALTNPNGARSPLCVVFIHKGR